jgi:hypothetical protein
MRSQVWFFCSCVLASLLVGGVEIARADETPAPLHWSLRPIVAPALPAPAAGKAAGIAVGETALLSPIDAFVQAKQREAGLTPSPAADRPTLIRRVTLDLTGLLPTPEDISAFCADSDPFAYERLVERLLASPAYGEQWGQHWLDVVRYAETEGFEYDRHRPDAWRFRDYVVESFNADKPFEQFLREQIAGDELAGPWTTDETGTPQLTPAQRELLVASGFHRLGAVRRNAGNPELAFSRHEVLTEMTDILGNAVLGLTIGCARCHDHKFDPIPQADYYHLQAYLAAAHEYDCVLAPPEEQARWKSVTEALNRQLAELRKTQGSHTGAQAEELEARVAEVQRLLPPTLPTLGGVRNREADRTEVHILKRGQTVLKGDQVGPRFLSLIPVAHTRESLPPEIDQPRTRLADQLLDAANPLPARVLANRVWQWHFGAGLVRTPNDFGRNGQEPSHPELLDWLAHSLVTHGWQLKPLHRQILLSATYRQASGRPDPRDPQNRLLAQFPRRRLTAGEVRDALLQVADRFNRAVGGPSVMTPVEADQVALLYAPSQWVVHPDPAEHHRRSIYLIAKRNLRLPFLETFDLPDAQLSCARRESSTHALQSLELLNGNLANELAQWLAHRLRGEFPGEGTATDGPHNVEARIDRACRLIAGRPPTEQELLRSRQFLAAQPLEEFCLALFNMNAFLYVE